MKKAKVFLCLMLSASLLTVSLPTTQAMAYTYYDEDDEASDDEDWIWDENEDEEFFEEDEEFFEEEDEEILLDDEITDDEYVYDDGDESYVIVYFEENGGDIEGNVYDMVVAPGEQYGTLPNATRKGFKFQGWFTKLAGGTQVTASTVCNAEEDVILYARWKSDGGYTITYHVDGGENSVTNDTSYVKSKNDVQLSDPTSDTQTFVGWYSDAKYTNSVNAISAGTTGNLSLYALFISNPSFSSVNTKNNTVTLKWKKCDNAVSYKIYQSTKAASGYKEVQTVKNKTTATIKNLKYNTSYFYKIAAVYKISGKNLTTDKSGSSEVYCVKGKSGTGASLKPAIKKTKIKSVSSKMKFYYQMDRSWKYSTVQKNVSGYFVSASMVLTAMGKKSSDPNKLYKSMGGRTTAFNPVKIQKNYKVTINKIDLTGTAKQKQNQLKEALANRTQGVIIRKNNKQVAVAYLDKKGNIKINDPSMKKGANLDITKTSFKKYSNIDFITTIDKK